MRRRRSDRRAIFGRRRRRGRGLVAIALLAVVGGAASWAVTTDWSDAGDATVAAPTEGVAASSETDTGPATTGATPTADPTGEALAGEAALATSPSIGVATELSEQRPPVTDRQRQLRRRTRRVIRSLAPSLEGADVAVSIRGTDGRRILDHGPGTSLMPASTMKAVTAATVLSVLGPDHRFTTAVATTGEVVDGVLHGDLVVIGGGDPVLATDGYRTHVYPARPATAIEDLADAVSDAGIRRVTGRVVGDGTTWGGSPTAAGWRQSYLDDHNARRIGTLTVDAGLDVKVQVPASAPVQVDLRGSRDPALRTARVFTRLLKQRDVEVRRAARAARLPVPTTDAIAHVSSPPVSELLRFTMEESDNHLADTMLRAAAQAATGDGSWASADRTATAVLDRLGVDTAGMRVADGSGLSRLDRLSAAQLADLDVAMMQGPFAGVWQDSLALTGRQGTLEYRLRGTAGEGRFFGKTGTLADAKAVAGHVVGATGARPRLHLAIVANGRPAGGIGAVSVLMDRLQMAMVDHVDGCSTTWEDHVPTRSCKGG